MLSAVFFFLMIRRPPRSTLDRSSAASDVYKRQMRGSSRFLPGGDASQHADAARPGGYRVVIGFVLQLSLIHISEPTRPY